MAWHLHTWSTIATWSAMTFADYSAQPFGVTSRRASSIRHRRTRPYAIVRSSANIDKLQRLQNTLARVVTNTRRRDHITPVLADLRWLPVRFRIEYKIALITFKALTTQQQNRLKSALYGRAFLQ